MNDFKLLPQRLRTGGVRLTFRVALGLCLLAQPLIFVGPGAFAQSAHTGQDHAGSAAKPSHAANVKLTISELWLRGAGGTRSEVVKIYNGGDEAVTVNATDGSSGYALAASDGVVRFVIPNGTVIAARDHYVGLKKSDAVTEGTKGGDEADAVYTESIADDLGVALFKTANPSNFTLANRLDAAGPSAEANPLFRKEAATARPALQAEEAEAQITSKTSAGAGTDHAVAQEADAPVPQQLQGVVSSVVPFGGAFISAQPLAASNAALAAGASTAPAGEPDQPPVVDVTAAAGQLIISEFRLRGPNGANDEFIEIYNASGADHTVTAASGTGYGVAASDGVIRCSIPNGTVIPNRGHYLCVNSVGYSLASYPAGNGTTATGDATYTTNIPDNAGIAIFNNNTGGASFSLANRLDAVGSTAEANALYKEGTGYPALTPFSIDYSFYRDTCGKGGSITTPGTCSIQGLPKDTDINAADFIFVDTNGANAGAGWRLGAPGPENLSSPIQRNASFTTTLLDTCVGSPSPPNRVRDFTSDPANNSTFGTLDVRRTFTNNTGANVTRLRFRVVDLTTFPAPSGFADLRPRTSVPVVVTVDRPPCGSGTSNVVVQGTTLEQPPAQPNGGGFNSSLSASTVTLATPLSPGASIDLRFLLGLQQTGTFRFYVNIEALP